MRTAGNNPKSLQKQVDLGWISKDIAVHLSGLNPAPEGGAMEKNEQSVQKSFEVLCQITRAQHFAWREAVASCCSESIPQDVVIEMWRITGQQTAQSYLKHMDKTSASASLPEQVARSIVWSSRSMGEDAAFEEDKDGVAMVRHSGCPWYDWHQRLGLLSEDQPGCDAWFGAIVEEINQARGSQLKFETVSSLPEGDSSCLRRFWVAQ